MIGFKEIARERLTPTSSTGFTTTNIPLTEVDTEYVEIQVVAGNKVNFITDGNVATVSTGRILTLYSKVEIWGGESLINFRCIDNGPACTVECTYMGRGS